MLSWQDIWRSEFLWNSVGAWTRALAAFLVTFTVLPLIKGFISARRRKWLQAQRELPTAIEVTALLIERTSRVFLWIIALYFASIQLQFPAHVERATTAAIVL